MPPNSSARSLRSKARRGFRGHPVITVAYYGPDDRRATKVAIGIVQSEAEDADIIDRFHADRADVRVDERINKRILDIIREYQGRSVIVTEGIIGCPHEEGIDYPEGEECPACTFWQGKDRWAGEPVPDRPSAERARALADLVRNDALPPGSVRIGKLHTPDPPDPSQATPEARLDTVEILRLQAGKFLYEYPARLRRTVTVTRRK